MILCICHGITYETILELVKEGKSVEEITATCGAGSSCGACLKIIYWEVNGYNKDRDKK